MAISQKQIMDRAYRLVSGTANDPHDSPTIDNQFAYEDAFPLALREAVSVQAKDPSQLAGLLRSYTLTFVAGSSALPDTVVEEHLTSSYFSDEKDNTNNDIISYQPNLHDYFFPSNPQLGHYALQGAFVLYRQPGGDAGVFADTGVLTTVGIPTIPGAITTDLGISTELAEQTIQILAEMVRAGVGVPAGGAQ